MTGTAFHLAAVTSLGAPKSSTGAVSRSSPSSTRSPLRIGYLARSDTSTIDVAGTDSAGVTPDLMFGRLVFHLVTCSYAYAKASMVVLALRIGRCFPSSFLQLLKSRPGRGPEPNLAVLNRALRNLTATPANAVTPPVPAVACSCCGRLPRESKERSVMRRAELDRGARAADAQCF